MTTIEDFLATAAEVSAPSGPADFRRDRWDRPLITPADGGNPKPYTRSSSAAKTIEDDWNLQQWQKRNLAYGLAYDASLAARVVALGGNPGTWTKDQRDEISRIIDDANKTAQAHKGADTGTALHTITERSDRGEQVDAGPLAGHLAAYRQALDTFGIVIHPAWIECRMVCDELAMAGTADRLVTLTPDSTLRRFLRIHHGIDIGDLAVVLDVKTGRTVDFGGLGFAAQLAAYGRGDLYDPATDSRLPTPELCRTHGIIVHLPSTATDPVCTIHVLDLEGGYRAAVAANVVREIRRESKGWLVPVTAAAVTDLADLVTGIDEAPDDLATAARHLEGRLRRCVEMGATAEVIRWPAEVPTFKQLRDSAAVWTDQDLVAVRRLVSNVEASVGAPFPDVTPDVPGSDDPPSSGPGAPLVAPAPTLKPDLELLAGLQARHELLPGDLQDWAHREAMAADLPTSRARWTTQDAATVATILDSAEENLQLRHAALDGGLDWDIPSFCLAVLATAEAPDPRRYHPTWPQVGRIIAVVDAIAAGALQLTFNDDASEAAVHATDRTLELLVERHGSKTQVLAAGRRVAKDHDLPAPKGSGDVATHPLLAALTWAADTNPTDTQETPS